MTDMEVELERLLAQEQELQFSEFTNSTALAIGRRLVEIGDAENLSITIDVSRHGQQLFHAALAGTTPDNDEWIKRKIRVVNHFFHSSYFVGRRYQSQGTTIEEKSLLSERDYAPHGGSFPIIIRNVGVVGTVTVSGLPQEEDHNLVVRALREFVDQ